MAYSTCSLNPIEDEAVVAALLVRAERAAPGSVFLEAWPQAELLPQLVRRPGVASWRVADHAERAARAGGGGGGGGGGGDGGGDGDGGDSDGDSDGGGVGGDGELRLRWHSSHERALAAGMRHAAPTLWPPPAAPKLHLERCSRMLHHDQDTGGFFVALLRKRKELPDAAAAAGAAA